MFKMISDKPILKSRERRESHWNFNKLFVLHEKI